MRLCLTFFSLALGCAMVVKADARVMITEHRDVNGKSTYWYITQERLAQTPEWKPDVSLPCQLRKRQEKQQNG